jgi:flagellar protein FlaF
MRFSQAEAYSRTQRATLTDREAEAAVLIKAAAMLRRVRTHWTAADRDRELDKALRHNQRLWTFFQVSLLDEHNALPVDLREAVLKLSAFVDRRIFEIMASPAPEKLDILITINTNLAAGLKGTAD